MLLVSYETEVSPLVRWFSLISFFLQLVTFLASPKGARMVGSVVSGRLLAVVVVVVVVFTVFSVLKRKL